MVVISSVVVRDFTNDLREYPAAREFSGSICRMALRAVGAVNIVFTLCSSTILEREEEIFPLLMIP